MSRSWTLLLSIGAVLALPSSTRAASVVLNEYNAVGSSLWLGNLSDPLCEGPAGISCSSSSDTFFGRVMGNGGNWFELAVVTDHVDLRNWQLFWEELGNGKVGTIFLSADPFWADVRAATIITFTESMTAQGGLNTDLSFDPCQGDWWVNVNTFDSTYVATTTTNVPGDGPGNFSVGNDLWQLTILNASGETVFGPAGEGTPSYSGSGVNDREICRLQADPAASITPADPYDDGTASSFGSPNTWSEAITNCRLYQDFAPAGLPVAESCQTCQEIILNEYNAVADGLYLNGGTQQLDNDGAQAADAFFGRVPGNGGDWLELIVIHDHLDGRGWRLAWADTAGSGTIFLSAHVFWSDLRAGTILTFTESTTAQGGLNTDLSYNPAAGDVWINVNTFDAAYVSSTSSTQPNHVSGQFEVSDLDWRLTVEDSAGVALFGPAGEGSIYYYRDGVSSLNVCRLEEDPASTATPSSAYDDGASSSTFGAVNTWSLCPSASVVQQNLGGLPDPSCAAPGNPADINGDGVVNVADLVAVISGWGVCPPDCPADVNGDGVVNVADLVAVIANWG